MKRLADFSTWPTQNEDLYSLYRLIEAQRAPHALLLVGRHETTKELAEYLAKTLLCTGDAAPCGHCESCRQFETGNHPDVVAVDGMEERSIKTAHIEEIQAAISVKSHSGGTNVYVLYAMELATPVAANRLLKTLEEPLPDVQAILTTSTPDKLLPTIRSRLFAFPVDDAIHPAHNSGLPDSEHSLENTEDLFVSDLEPVIKWTHVLLSKRESSLVLAAQLQEMADNGQAAKVLDKLGFWLHSLIRFGVGLTDASLQHLPDLKMQSALVTVVQLAKAVELVAGARSRLQAHVVSQLNFEQLCIRLRGVL